MTTARRKWAIATAVAAARLHRRLGWPGIAGAGLIAISAVVVLCDRDTSRTNAANTLSQTTSQPAPPGKPTGTVPVEVVKLVQERDLSLVLARMERAALAERLVWNRVDYRQVPATSDGPASMEVSTSLRGPYLSIRRLVATMLRDTPALTLRSLSVTRPDPDTAEVEAKLTAAVLLEPSGRPAIPSLEKDSPR